MAAGGRDAVAAAARSGHTCVLEFLAEHGLHPRVGGGWAVVCAAQGGSLEALEWLGARGLRTDDYSTAAVAKAIEFGQDAQVLVVLARNFEVPLSTCPVVVERSFKRLPPAGAYPKDSIINRTLLINLLTVPTSVAERSLESVAQQVVGLGISRALMSSYMRAAAFGEEPTQETLRRTIAPSARAHGVFAAEAAEARAQLHAERAPPRAGVATPGAVAAARKQKATGAGGFEPTNTASYDQRQKGWRAWLGYFAPMAVTSLRHVRRLSDENVRLARVAVPGLLGPEVLRALAAAPREEVFATLAARAIVLAAWEKVKAWYYVDLVLDLVFLAAVCHLTTTLKTTGAVPEDVDEFAPAFEHPWPASIWVCIAIWVLNVAEELLQAKAFLHDRPEWRHDYLSSGNAMDWLRNVATFVLFVLIFAHARAMEVCPMLALVCFGRWWKVLYALRGLDYFGERLLPILGAFREVFPFTLVLVFYAGAFVHGFYVFSQNGLDRVLLSVYRMGVLDDFAMDTDVFGSPDRQIVDPVTANVVTTAGPKMEWWYCQLFLFVATTFMLTVAMMNIFIQVMGSAFDRQEEVCEALFFRARASICLYYSLRPGAARKFSERDVVWMCYLDKATDERGQARSMRQSVARACARIGRQLETHLDKMETRFAGEAASTNRRLHDIESSVLRVESQFEKLFLAILADDDSFGSSSRCSSGASAGLDREPAGVSLHNSA